MYKIAVLGDKDSIYGFASVGIGIYPVENASEGTKILRSLADDHAVIFITEKLASEMEGEITRYRDRTVPAIIPIPGIIGNTGFGMKSVSRCVEQAVGSDIIQ